MNLPTPNLSSIPPKSTTIILVSNSRCSQIRRKCNSFNLGQQWRNMVRLSKKSLKWDFCWSKLRISKSIRSNCLAIRPKYSRLRQVWWVRQPFRLSQMKTMQTTTILCSKRLQLKLKAKKESSKVAKCSWLKYRNWKRRRPPMICWSWINRHWSTRRCAL